MICPICQTVNRDGANFCRHCGHHFGLICPRCRTVLLDDSLFCDRCGFQLAEATPLQVAPQTAQRPTTQSPIVPTMSAAPPMSAPRMPMPPMVPVAPPAPPIPPPQIVPTAPVVAESAAVPRSAQRDSLERYASREYLAKLEAARARSDSTGERRIVTILFCDVKGSTAAAEHLDPEDWTDIMNGAFETMIKPVYDYEGIVARLMGDAILAFFGAPITHEDDAERGVMAALGIVNSLRPYREALREKQGIDFDIRIGINTGLVFVGGVGSDLHMEYTAMGDAINVAARMEQTAQPGTVQIADATYRLVAPLFNIEPLDEIDVKGKSAPVKAYRVLSRSDVREPQRGIPGLEAPLIGRDREVALLKGVLADAGHGVGRIVCIEGDAGLGKSRLLRAAGAEWRALAGDGMWFPVSSLSYENQHAYSLLRTVIQELLGISTAESGPPLAERLTAALTGLDDDLCLALTPVLHMLFNMLDPGEMPLEGEAFRQKLFDALWNLCVHKFRDKPAVLVFNDFHWADSSSVDLIEQLLALSGELPLVFLFALRPERGLPAWGIKAYADSHFHHRYVETTLAPLSDSESAAMIAGLLEGTELPAPLVARMVERAGGNPFYIEEVVRSLIDGGVVVREQRIDGDEVGVGWRATRDSAEFDIPDNLQSLLIARIDRLEEEARLTLQLASVIGRTLYRRVLAAVDTIGQRLDTSLMTLLQLDMIQEAARVPEFEYRFRNPLTQEAVYGTILLKRRREFHRRVGESIERLFPDRLEEMAPRLAYHFAEGGDFAHALTYYRLAGDSAARLYAHVEASGHYLNALDAAERADAPLDTRIELYLRRGRSSELANQFVEALQLYDEMVALGDQRNQPTLKLAGLLAAATLYGTQTPLANSAKALTASNEALEMARSLGDRAAEAKALWNVMLVNDWSEGGDTQKAIQAGEAALAITRELNLREQMGFTLVNLGAAYANANDLERALATTVEARQIWRELGNRTMEGDSYSQTSWLHAATGNFDAALADADEGIKIGRAIGNQWNQGVTSANQCAVFMLRGELENALEAAQRAEKLADEAHLPQSEASRALIACVYVELGLREKALAVAQIVMDNQALMPAALEPFGFGVLASAYVRLGHLAEAALDLKRSHVDFDNINSLSWINSLSFVGYAELLAARKDYPTAREVLPKISNQLRRTGNVAYLSDVLFLQAEIFAALGQTAEASAMLADARELAERLGVRHVLWRILAAQRDLAAQAGQTAEAVSLGQQARQSLDSIATSIHDETLRASFLARPDVQAMLAPSNSAAQPSS